MVEWLFLAVPWGCLRFVIVVFPDHTHLLFVNASACVIQEYTSTNAAKMIHGEKKTLLALFKPCFTFFSFSDWYSPLLRYLLVSSINIVDI